jgi:O-antigen/teichoic acid export membrane protein
MPKTDSTGRKQLSRNVLTSWLSHSVFIVFGFVMPRMIDHTLGQEALGVWDFGWAVVSYLSVTMVGIGSSVNRYVANYRAAGETDNLSRTMSSVVAVQLVIALFVSAATLVIAYLVPVKLHSSLGDLSSVAGKVVLYLGLSLAVQMAFDSCRGVLTGVHRWTAYNTLNAVGYSVSSLLMIGVLVSGHGLEGMAISFLVVTILTELIRWFLARRAYPTIVYRLSFVNLPDIKKVFVFGVKNVALFLPRLIVRQTVNIFVVTHMGPAMLAILARPQALISHVQTLINKFSFVLTPTAGSLQGGGQASELREFAISSMRTSWILTVLPTSFLFVLGDKLVDLWMGDGYGHWGIMAILSAGSVLPMAASAALTLLSGLNEHGRVVKLSLLLSLLTLALVVPMVYVFGWTLEIAAFITIIPLNFGVGIVAVVVGCLVLKISAKDYVTKVLAKPVSVAVICVLALFSVRTFGPEAAWQVLLLGATVQLGVVLATLWPDIRTLLASLRKE